MKSHVYRPLFVVIAFVLAILAARVVFVPDDFGVHEMGYRFGWHRLGNEQEWKDFTPKFEERTYCAECHPDKAEAAAASPHGIINCQNCHGPASRLNAEGVLVKHGVDSYENERDTSRALCLRCHAAMPVPGSGRASIPAIVNSVHNPENNCVDCHDPHSPGL
jgi:hypothetical protein